MKNNKDDHKTSTTETNDTKTETARDRARRKWKNGLTSEQISRYLNESIQRDIQWNRPLIRAAAIRYSGLGLSVIPIHPRTKVPCVTWKPYQKTAATPEETKVLWDKFPDAQIAIVTGRISNLVVLDFDGPDVKERFETEVCRIPETIMQKTGRFNGGFHCLFSYPVEGIGNTNSKIFENVDIKGEGGYFVASPSIHKSGRQYKWINFDPFTDDLSSLADLPVEFLEWWREYQQKKNAPAQDRVDLNPLEILKGVPEGKRNDTLFRYACRLNTQGLSGEEIGVLVRQANSSSEKPLPESEIQSLMKSALKYQNKGNTSLEIKHADIKIYTASELITSVFPEPKWAIPGILPEGLNILAGKPKVGKSILALNVCIAVAFGGKAFNKIPVEKGSVIYLALEDTPKRLQRRLKDMVPKGPARIETDNLLIARSWPRMNDGGLTLLQKEIGKCSDLRLVIIDTLVKFRPATVGKFINQYEIEYEHVSRIKNLADENNISILLIHHRRKTEAEDVFDTFSGSHGLTGAADGLLALIRNKNKTELHIIGRDIEKAEYALEFNAREMCWNLLGRTEDVQSSIVKQEVFNVLQESDDTFSPKELSELTGIDKHYVQKALGKLVSEGKITWEGRGKYKGEGIKG